MFCRGVGSLSYVSLCYEVVGPNSKVMRTVSSYVREDIKFAGGYFSILGIAVAVIVDLIYAKQLRKVKVKAILTIVLMKHAVTIFGRFAGRGLATLTKVRRWANNCFSDKVATGKRHSLL